MRVLIPPPKARMCTITLSPQNRCLVNVPRNVWHADHNIGTKDVVVINFPTIPYDHKSPDKYRLPIARPHSHSLETLSEVERHVLRWIAVAQRCVVSAQRRGRRGVKRRLQQDSHVSRAVIDGRRFGVRGAAVASKCSGSLLISLGAVSDRGCHGAPSTRLTVVDEPGFAIVERATGSATTGRVAAAAGLEPTLLL
jgi:hypothetical protein